MKKSAFRIFRAYLLCAVFSLCATAVACGVFVADSSTRAVAGGYDASVAAAVRSDNKLSVSVKDKNFELDLPDNPLHIASLLPFPVGNIASVCENVVNIIEYYLSDLSIVHK